MLCDEIKELIKNDKLILFIGAGVPATLKLPTWSGLIDNISDELGYEHEIFKRYGDYLSLIEFYKLTKGHIGELRDAMSREFAVSMKKLKKSAIYRCIANSGCKIIYTTNYDHSIEQAFDIYSKPYKRIVDAADFTEAKMDDTLIIKFHGDIIRDSSMVLTESDYFERLKFESAMDIRLRSDMLGKAVLFIGYSLSDINLRLMIYMINELWSNVDKKMLKPKSYIFLAKPNPVQETIFKSRGIVPIIGTEIDPSESLEGFLRSVME